MNEPVRALPSRLAILLVFLAGGGVLVLEIVGIRLVAPYVGITLETSTAVIGVALAAIAYGAWFGGRLADRLDPRRLIAPALLLGGASTALVLPIVRWAGEWLRGAAVPGVVLLTAMTLFLPAALLSAVTPMVVKLQLADLGKTGTVVGRLSGANTLGAITATFGTGFVLVALLPSSAIVIGLAVVLAASGVAMSAYLSRRGAIIATVIGIAATGLTVGAPHPCTTETSYHCAVVTVDPDRPSGRTLWLNSARHSYVDIENPLHLEYSYTKVIGSVVDVAAPPGAALDTLHLGGGGLTLPGYLAQTRPASRSRVLEVDRALLDLDAQLLRMPPGLQRWAGDARVGIGLEGAQSWNLVIGDAFGHLSIPWHLTTVEMVAEVQRVLRPGGIYALNVIDEARGRFVRAQTATVAAVFAHSVVVAPGYAIDGTGSRANFIILASDTALPLDALRTSLARRGLAMSIVDGESFAGGARVLRDDFAPVDQMMIR